MDKSIKTHKTELNELCFSAALFTNIKTIEIFSFESSTHRFIFKLKKLGTIFPILFFLLNPTAYWTVKGCQAH